jgi:hypothetical protein
MNRHAIEQPTMTQLQIRLESAAQNLPYPPTPDIADRVKHQLAKKPAQPRLSTRRLAWGMTVVVLGMVILLSVPAARAIVLEALRQSPLRVFLFEPFPTTTPLVTITPSVSVEAPLRLSSPQPSETTPRPSTTPISSLLSLPRETTPSSESQTQVDLPVRLPARPLALRSSNQVFRPQPNLGNKRPDQPGIDQNLCYNEVH